jgi:hypothetical protein
MNPMTYWGVVLTLEARVESIRAYFNWLTQYQLTQAAALSYGALPTFIRRDVQLASLDHCWRGPRYEP